ncbi:hypothetical protein [Candidatus Nesciobacter abundans]|uniref:SurA N-terminal domain-containing protein n=1 Tax=Candidatus Nesciobacter abundans TaxID=2601668 RepID=A0A5C0UHL9_9PROT|nr:hypothetical protein [Candidatus Nesciobacter abundans]QEK39227.1 hypothetical protein FZC36_02210 [Candidatus Nesciobacter abundans]
MIRKMNSVFFVFVLSVLFGKTCFSDSKSKESLLDKGSQYKSKLNKSKVLAVVVGKEITYSEVIKFINANKSLSEQFLKASQDSDVKKVSEVIEKVLNLIIKQKIMKFIAENKGYDKDDKYKKEFIRANNQVKMKLFQESVLKEVRKDDLELKKLYNSIKNELVNERIIGMLLISRTKDDANSVIKAINHDAKSKKEPFEKIFEDNLKKYSIESDNKNVSYVEKLVTQLDYDLGTLASKSISNLNSGSITQTPFAISGKNNKHNGLWGVFYLKSKQKKQISYDESMILLQTLLFSKKMNQIVSEHDEFKKVKKYNSN